MVDQHGTGIAGAMDYQPARHEGRTCVTCGVPLDANTPGNPSARAVPGLGLIHACSKVCAEDDLFRIGASAAEAERAVCCGPACKRPEGDCVAHTYGRGILQRARDAGFAIIKEAPRRV